MTVGDTAREPKGRPEASGGDAALHTAYDVALLDLDGVVYIGGTPIPGAADALRQVAADGMRLAYVTNNAYRTPAAVAELLTRFGVQATAEDVVTSAQAAARLLAEKLPAGAKVLVVGGAGLRLAVRERGLRPVSVASERPQAVVQGYAPGVDYPALAEGGLAVAAGALFVATNADSTLPGPHGRQPGNGSLLQVIATATGVMPVVAGKPEPPLHRESVLRTGARNPLVVGDRLDTDIEAAHRVGADSLLVLTGVTRPADAVLAPPHQRPRYIAAGLPALLEPYPAIEAVPSPLASRAVRGTDGDGFRCRAWFAYWDRNGHLALTDSGAGDAVFRSGGPSPRTPLSGSGGPFPRTPGDGLRALCAAAWSRDNVTAEMVAPALDRLRAAGLRI